VFFFFWEKLEYLHSLLVSDIQDNVTTYSEKD